MGGVPSWAGNPSLISFYKRHRNSPEDLYSSEARFLGYLASRSRSVLDAGCAAGGFAAIWRHYSPRIEYRGVDVSEQLLGEARRLHPDLEFVQANVADGTPLPDRAADVVSALGWLHWEPRWEAALSELWRLTGRHLFFDLRLVESAEEQATGRQRVAFEGQWDGVAVTPWQTLSWPFVAERLLALRPSLLVGAGYMGSPADTVVGIEGDVCFAAFVAVRGASAERPVVSLSLPFSWPPALADRVELRPASELDELLENA